MLTKRKTGSGEEISEKRRKRGIAGDQLKTYRRERETGCMADVQREMRFGPQPSTRQGSRQCRGLGTPLTVFYYYCPFPFFHFHRIEILLGMKSQTVCGAFSTYISKLWLTAGHVDRLVQFSASCKTVDRLCIIGKQVTTVEQGTWNRDK